MSLDKQKSIETMRTFARDVEREKGKSEEAKEALADLPTAEDGQEDTRSHTAAPVSTGKHEPVIKVSAKDAKKKEPEKKEDKKEDKPKEEKKTVVKKSAEPAHIPAFHELQKAKKTDIKVEPEETEKKEKKETKKKEKKKDKKEMKPIITSGGTVITDNKKNEKPFFAELQKSISAWFTKLKKSLKPKKNTYSVTKTERRKGVVQKATSKTGTIFTADSDTLKEQIKARQRAEKREHEDDDLTWSPYTEPGYPLLEGEEAESNDPRVLKVAVTPKTSVVKPKPVIKSTDKIAELKEEKEEPTKEELDALEEENKKAEAKALEEKAKKEAEEVKEEVVEEKVKPEPEETTPEETPEQSLEDEILDVLSPEEDGEEVEEEEEQEWNLEDVDLKDTNTLAMLIVGVFLALGVFGFVLFGIFGFGSDEGETMTKVEAVPTYQDASISDVIIFNLTFNEIVGRINTTLVSEPTDKTIEYQFVNARSHAVPGDVLMETIRTVNNDGFADTVSELRFVKTADGERALVLTTSDATMTLGGMLNWEDSLYSDVGSILDIQNSIPPSAGEFVDTKVGKLDARALEFDSNTLLIYAIVNGTDVIIASDRSVLAPYSE